MNRLFFQPLAPVVLLSFLIQAAVVSADEAKKGTAADLRGIQPLLEKHCVSCHGSKKPRAQLDLTALAGNPTDRATWRKVWERIRSGQMPPPDQPQPTAQERERMTEGIEAVFAQQTLDGHADPGSLRPRRLNVREYRNTLRDLATTKGNALPRKVAYSPKKDGSVNLYQAIVPPPEHPCAFVSRTLPQDTSEGGFDTVGENLSFPPLLMEKYLRCSKLLMDDMFSLNAKRGGSYQWPLYADVMAAQKGPWPRGITNSRQAVSARLKEFATRAFRRPVTAEEVAKYARLFDAAQEQGEDFETSIRLPLQAILVSPRCVVLWSDAGHEERGKDAAPVRQLDDYELATRLSYFLWSSTPDRELFQLAEKGQLKDPRVIEAQVRRMLHDRRITDGLVEGFLCQWLQLDKLDRNTPDPERYAFYFQNNLGEMMKHELLLFADAVMVEDRSILEFVDADWGFVCYPLAQHYGIEDFPGKKPPSNASPPWYRVKFTNKRRGGVLTMGKVLTGTSQPLRTSPVHRGKWMLETILGTPPPPPPPDVDNVLKEEKEEGKKSLTVRQRLERHRSNAACYSCHQLIDPVGMALETFDPVGRWRDKDQDQPIDAAGSLRDGRQFKGVEELKALLLSRKEDFTRCYVERMLTYALGRKLELSDAATVKQIAQAAAQDDYKFSRVVVEVAKSYPFRHRRVREPTE
jgi:mono/diheme cytochrome c family protein